MPRLCLRFAPGEPPRLDEVEFEHPLRKSPGKCVRARDNALIEASGTFQWSKAVRSLATFLLRGAAAAKDSTVRNSTPELEGHLILSGERGSPASALAYALEKQPQWMRDMFGVDSRGTSILRRLIQRANASQRSGKPVSMRWRHTTFDGLEFVVYRGSQRLQGPVEWKQLADRIDSLCSPQRSRSRAADTSSATAPSASSWKENLIGRTAEEIVRSLHVSDTFTPSRLQFRLSSIRDHRELNSRIPREIQLLHRADQETAALCGNIYSAECQQEIETQLRQQPALRLAMGAVPTANTIIFYYLQRKKGIPLIIDDHYLHTMHLVSELQANNSDEKAPDLIAAGLPPIISFLASPLGKDFSPLMLMPYHSVRAVSIGGNPAGSLLHNSSASGILALSAAQISSEALYIERLQESDPGLRSRVHLKHVPSNDLFKMLRSTSSEMQILSFFPFYHLYNLALEGSHLGPAAPSQTYFDSVLIARKSLLSTSAKARALTLAIRQSWFELANDRELVEEMLRELLNQSEYLNRFLTSAGLSIGDFQAASSAA